MRKSRWNCILAVFSALILLAVAGVTIAAIILDAEQSSVQRYCFSDGTTGLLGSVTTSLNARTIDWDMQYNVGDMGATPHIYIKGPIPAGDSVGPLFLALCGTPSTLACDSSVPGVRKGSIDQTNPGGLSLTASIKDIRAAPWRYYVEIGSARVLLTSICGVP